MTEKRYTLDELDAILRARLADFPAGVLPDGRARMGAALHSETMMVLDVRASDSQAWSLHPAQDTDAKAFPFDPNEQAGYEPAFSTDTTALTPETVSAMALRHYSGGLYTGIICASLDGKPFGLYASPEGVWWARPWDMFADGRFTPVEDAPARRWRELTDQPDA